MNDLFQQFSLQLLITDPTHYTEITSSTIDLIFTVNSNNILLSGICEPFLEQNVRYHSPVYAVFKFHTTEMTKMILIQCHVRFRITTGVKLRQLRGYICKYIYHSPVYTVLKFHTTEITEMILFQCHVRFRITTGAKLRQLR